MELKRKEELDEIEDDIEEPIDDKEDLNDDLGMDDLKDDYLGDDLMDDFYDGAKAPMDKHKELLKDLTNFEIYLKNTYNNWLGLVWNEEAGKFVRDKKLKPVMNIHGASWCSGLLKTYARGNNIITNIREEEYKFIMGDHVEAIWLNLGTRDDLGITSDGDLIRVCNELEHAAALILMGAGDGKYNQFLGTAYSAHYTGQPGQQQFPGQPIVVNNNIPRKIGAIGKLKKFLVGEGGNM
jgi:hypothetical protein